MSDEKTTEAADREPGWHITYRDAVSGLRTHRFVRSEAEAASTRRELEAAGHVVLRVRQFGTEIIMQRDANVR